MTPNPLKMDEHIVPLREAARQLHAPTTALYALCVDGTIPSRKVGGIRLINVEDAEKAMRQRQERQATKRASSHG